MPAVTEFELWWETYSPQGVDHWRGYEQAKAAWDEGCNAGAGHERERASKLEESAPSASTNTGSPKLPSIEECYKAIPFPEDDHEQAYFVAGIAECHIFIVRQLETGTLGG